MSEPLKIGAVRPWGEATCGFGLPEPACSRPATKHYILDDDVILQACDEHAEYIEARDNTVIDAHPFAGACGMPGAFWIFGSPDMPGGCQYPIADDMAWGVAEPEVAHV